MQEAATSNHRGSGRGRTPARTRPTSPGEPLPPALAPAGTSVGTGTGVSTGVVGAIDGVSVVGGLVGSSVGVFVGVSVGVLGGRRLWRAVLHPEHLVLDVGSAVGSSALMVSLTWKPCCRVSA